MSNTSEIDPLHQQLIEFIAYINESNEDDGRQLDFIQTFLERDSKSSEDADPTHSIAKVIQAVFVEKENIIPLHEHSSICMAAEQIYNFVFEQTSELVCSKLGIKNVNEFTAALCSSDEMPSFNNSQEENWTTKAPTEVGLYAVIEPLISSGVNGRNIYEVTMHPSGVLVYGGFSRVDQAPEGTIWFRLPPI